MMKTFGEAVGNTIVRNLDKNAEVDPKNVALGLVVTTAITALTVITKTITANTVDKAMKKKSNKKVDQIETINVESNVKDEKSCEK